MCVPGLGPGQLPVISRSRGTASLLSSPPGWPQPGKGEGLAGSAGTAPSGSPGRRVVSRAALPTLTPRRGRGGGELSLWGGGRLLLLQTLKRWLFPPLMPPVLGLRFEDSPLVFLRRSAVRLASGLGSVLRSERMRKQTQETPSSDGGAFLSTVEHGLFTSLRRDGR